ncbi:hypothetical protein CAL22_13480 [Bordetella genomosp. 12]|uniref:Uncharacterized protein n=1 Tax=Bordetella genomosp. 12 TaxID=463035 RepID=A0A261VEK4_9BORD|nr:hypothetical protein CAL22_13480 [Bordetella genomosp. 12]
MPFLAGCSTSRPPYVVVFHSYFPSWIPCAIGGCIAAVLLRVILVRRGLDEYLPLHLLTYLAFAAAVMFMLSLLIFAR